MTDRQPDDIPVPCLRFPEAGALGSAAAAGSTPEAPRQPAEPQVPARTGGSKAVPIAVAAVTAGILIAVFGDIDLPMPLLIAAMAVLLAFGVYFRHR